MAWATVVLIVVAAIRELFGAGKLLGIEMSADGRQRRLVQPERPDAAAAQRLLHHRAADLGAAQPGRSRSKSPITRADNIHRTRRCA